MTALDIRDLGPHERDLVRSVRWLFSYVAFGTEARPMTDWLVYLLRSTKKPIDWNDELLIQPWHRLSEALPRIAKYRASVKDEPFRMEGRVENTAAEMLLRLLNEVAPTPKGMRSPGPFGCLGTVVRFLPACSHDDPTLAAAVVKVARTMAEFPRDYLPEELRPAFRIDLDMPDMWVSMGAEEREAAATEIRDCVHCENPISFVRTKECDHPGQLLGRRFEDIPHEHDAELVNSVCELVAHEGTRQKLTSTVGCFFSSQLKKELESLYAELKLELAGIVDQAFSCEAQGERPDERTVRHSPDFRSLKWGRQHYTFSGSQAAVVRVLYEAWENGASVVGDDTLCEAADHAAPRERLRDVFKDHEAWNTLIVPGNKRGTRRLADPK